MDIDKIKRAQHLIQKYKLAVAIAVIQTTPESKSLDEHLIDLKDKFNNEKMDDAISICSDDFDVDFNDFIEDASQNSDTILKDFNDAKIACNVSLENNHKDVFSDAMDIVQNIGHDESQLQQNNNDNQSTFCETQTQLDISLAPDSLTDIDKTFCDSIARLHRDNIMDIDKACDNIAKIYNTPISTDITSCKSINIANKNNDLQTYVNTVEINREMVTKADSNKTQQGNVISNVKDTSPVSFRQYFEETRSYDSQATELYTIQCHTQNYTHVSQSQSQNFDVSNKYIIGTNKNNRIRGTNENINDSSMNTEDSFNHLKDVNLVRNININLDKENNIEDESYNFDQNTQIDVDNREIDEQFQNSQGPSIVYNSENLLPKNFKDDNLVRKICKNLEQDNAANYNERDNSQKNLTHQNCAINDKILQDKQVIFAPSNANTENYTQNHFNVDKFQNTAQFVTQTNNTTALNEISRNKTENMTMQVFNFSQKDPHVKDFNKVIINDANDSEDEDTSNTELVPFKVMEELNRVKAYLNKGVERRIINESSLDSGYRSDSQGRHSQGRSRSGFQLSGNWVGQSGYCLFDYLTKCPLVAATEEIVTEISEVLGQLIDKLHELESYPSFLEELLAHVDSLISCIFTEEDMVLDKEEKIQRLFLLNKSIHIQKYSLEKLTDILEDIHTHLTDKEELYELTDIQKIENLSYIFHVLEIIIKRLKNKNKKVDNSQSGSQETDKYPKKSSISDIWRKKWNPNYKEELKIESLEKKCVLKKCNEVLNKIVVGCMDGYSLVAYAALQCFNMLQS